VHHLGADVPVDDLIELTRATAADLIVLSSSSADAIRRAQHAEREILARLPEVRVLSGGQGGTLRELLDRARAATRPRQ
jgi:methanogenic corrinoid protein MtbC1